MESNSRMVIFRDSDQVAVDQQLSKRGGKRSPNDIMCAMEELAYNRRTTGSHAAPSINASLGDSSFANLWEKRSSLGVMPQTPDPVSITQGCPTARKSKISSMSSLV